MAYVDLNPVRAEIAQTPEESEFTSIYERIRETKVLAESQQLASEEGRPPLLRFQNEKLADPCIPFPFPEYLALVDWTGRSIRDWNAAGRLYRPA